jgi:hypothetical protein
MTFLVDSGYVRRQSEIRLTASITPGLVSLAMDIYQ